MCRAYYNEIEPYCAQWLRNLIDAAFIPDGDVDTRSISEVTAADVKGYTQCHFFAGIGGWPHALRLAGWRDDRAIWTGSCPCQPFSAAGRQQGEADARHLWPDFHRLIGSCRPGVVMGEQVSSRLGMLWLDGVCEDFEASGYAVRAMDIPACGVGAPHIRQRLYWLANTQHAEWGTEHQKHAAAYGRYGPGGRGNAGWVANTLPGGRTEGRAESGDGPLTGGGAAGRLADAERRGRGARGLAESVDGVYAGWPHHSSETEEPGSLGTQRLGNSHDPRSQGRRLDAGEHPDQLAAGAAGAAGGLGHSLHSERRTLDRPGKDDLDGDDDGRQEADGKSGAPGKVCFWSDYSIVHCTDGKARRIEPGTFPLVAGATGRMGKLRAYGNAIVPQVAAEVIRAYMETEQG